MPALVRSRLVVASALLVFTLGWPAAVAAQPREAARDDRFELPVTGGRAALERLGIHPEERGSALVLFARALHGMSATASSGSLAVVFAESHGTATTVAQMALADGPAASVLAPFSDRAWRRALALDDGADLFAALVKTRGALLVATGALQAAPSVRLWLGGDTSLLQRIIRLWPGAFAQAGAALRLEGDHLAVPGGAAYEPGWTALVGASPARREDFLRRLLARDDGRLARFFAALDRLEEPRRAALLQPLPGEDRTAALAALYRLANDAESPWPSNVHPFQLSYADLPSVLHAVHDVSLDEWTASGGWWPLLLTSRVRTRADAEDLLRREPSPASYAATVRAMLNGVPRQRRDHMAVIAMARRASPLASTPQTRADLLYALAQFSRYRALLLTLDRIEVRDPAVWARLVDAARRVDARGSRDRELRLGLFQGALALVERATLVGSLSRLDSTRVLQALGEAVESDASAGAIKDWLLDHFVPALPPLVRPDAFTGRTAYESRVLQALAGPPGDPPIALTWEGLDYGVDVVAAEHARILAIRAQLPSPGLDRALDNFDAATLAASLRALAYAPALGDPEGSVTLSPDVVTRHDLGGPSAGREFAWLPAHERSGSGAPWHVAGSLLGLDLALARSALRRLSADDMPPVPSVNLNDQLTLARTAVAVSARHLDDDTRDELAAAMARGRRRVEEAGRDLASLLALGAETGMTAAEREALPWTLATIETARPVMFSLRDLLWLGRPQVAGDVLARWGVVSDPVDGRLATRFDAPVPWDRLAGRPDTGVLATQAPDLMLRLVAVTAEKQVPAVLIPWLLLFATQDYWHEVEARFADDWPAMVRGAAALPVARVEDYIAALGSGGPLLPR